jgi:tetratricopeptide (TPR) repeat protein
VCRLRLKSWPKCSLLLVLAAAPVPAVSADELARIGQLCFLQEYDSAFAAVRSGPALDTGDPAGYYWQASIIQVLTLDSGDVLLADSFYVLANAAVARAGRRLRKNPHDAEANFYLGMTQLNRSSMLAWQRRTWDAFFTLFGVGRHLQAAMADDSSLTDARMGIGIIEYFKASAGRYVPGLGFLGSKKRGFQLVSAVADGRGMLGPAAQFLLAFMLKEDGDYAATIVHCRELLDRYPGNRTAMRMMRDAQYRAGRFSDAVATGREVEQSFLRAFPGNRYALAENWLVCGMAFAGLGQADSARNRFDRVIAWEQYQSDVPWLSVYVREARHWLGRLKA